MRKGVNFKLNNNKGFTLVELLVVLVLMTILFSIAIFSALGWIDWARFKHEESAAEDIFYAVQNQLTELDSSGAFDRVMQDYLWDSNADSQYYENEDDSNYVKGNYASNYVLAQGKESVQIGANLFNSSNGILNSDGTYYEWNKLWKDKNLSSQKRTIIKLVVDAGRYDVFVANSVPAGVQPLSSGEKLLFNLIAPYISDKSVLNGAIAVEFSPEAAQVFSVCYSDQASSLTYDDTTGNGAIGIKDRRLQTRESRMLGYFGVDTLTSKVRGRSKSINGYRLEIINNNTLNLRLGSSTGSTNVLSGTKLTYRIYGALKYNNNGSSYPEIMNFTIEKADVDRILDGEKGLENYTEVSAKVTFSDGIYAGSSDKSFRFPMWSDKAGNIYIALDAADIQAQSLTYAESLGFIDESNGDKTDAQKRFMNTYSFYRFGLPNIRFIRAEVDVEKEDGGDVAIGTAKSGVENEDGKFVEHSIEGEAPRGSAVTFADPKKDDNEESEDAAFESFIYGIENGRHLYNVRFESDYGDDLDKYLKDNSAVTKDVKKTYILRSDIDWEVFTGKAEDEHGVKQNYLFNSYIEGAHTAEEFNGCLSSGINVLAGNDPGSGINRYELAYVENNNTADYPFPGYRMLSFGDTFTQEQDITDLVQEDGSKAQYYKLSNINISLAANYIYGVYGKTLQKNIDNINIAKNYDFSSLNTYGESGYIPLGFFAQNNGIIKNIEFDNIVVNGVEGYPIDNPADNHFVYTSKVGGVAGENLGTIENIYIDEYNRYTDSEPDYNSYVKGYSDVGGIVGHQYYIYVDGDAPASQDGIIQKCINNADVSGVSYVGGIIGRIYPTAAEGLDSIALYDSKYTVDGLTGYFSDNYIVPSSKIDTVSYSYSKADLSSFTIDQCKNRGEVSLDPLFVRYVIGDNSLHRGFYFGGITGAALNNVNPDNNSGFTGYNHDSDESQKVVISNCDSCQLYKVDGDNGLEQIVNPSSADADQVLKSKSKLRTAFVGGLVGGIRYGYIINCSTTPNENDKEGGKLSFVFGDRYVGGVAGYSYESDYIYDEAFRNDELNKLENGADILAATGHTYNMINGTGVLGNYAVGGITGCFGAPDTGDENENFGQNSINSGLSDANKYDYPVNGNRVNNSWVDGLLNTSIVLGFSYDATVNTKDVDLNIADPSEDVSVGRYFYGVGGIAGVLATNLESCDFIQTEYIKGLTILLAGQGTGLDYSSISGINGLFEDNSSAISNLKKFVNKSQLATDGVGGIVGHTLSGGNINAKHNNVRFDSQVDAVIFGRNRVGGAVGDTVANNDGNSRLANIVPARINSESSGMYVIGYENVGGLVGAFSDNGGGENGLNYKLDYDGKPMDKMFHVLGYRAVGGLIGTFYKYNGTGSRKTINATINTNAENSKVRIKGSMYVGGIVGIQELFDGRVKDDGISYKGDKRYRVTLKYTTIDAECFAGIISGAMFGSDKKYCPADNLAEKVDNAIGHRVFATADIAVSYMAGIYAYNNYPNSKIVNGSDMSVLVCKKDNSNYKVHKDSSDNIVSYNGLYNLSEIRDFKYDADDDLLKSKNDIYSTFDEYQEFDSKSERPVQEIQDYMNMADLSQSTQPGSNSHAFAIAKIHAGGFAGYIPKNTYIKIKNYKNRAVLRTYEAVKSQEAGDGDTTDYSYLGAVSGKIPVGMIANNCWNTSEEYNDNLRKNSVNGTDTDYNPTGQYGFFNSKKATYKGGVAEVNAGIVEGNITNLQDGITFAHFNKYLEFNKGKGTFVGVNGTEETDGEKSGIIRNCTNNNFIIIGNIIGGMAAVAGGSSSIEGCTNSQDFTAETVDGAEGYAGGILGGVMECLKDEPLTIILKDNKNTASVKDSTNKHSAGIVYNSLDIVDIILCRNYSEGPKYAMTSTEDGKTARSIKYSWDASGNGNANNNITNKAFTDTSSTRNTIFGDVTDRGESDDMYANFFVGEKTTDYTTTTFEPAKVNVFAANKFYITNEQYHGNSSLTKYDRVEGSEKRIDDIVFSDDPDKTKSYAVQDENSKKLAFELLPVKKINDSTGYNKNIYADVDEFSIEWTRDADIVAYYKQIKDIDLSDLSEGDEFYAEYAEFTDNTAGASLLDIADTEYGESSNKPEDYSDAGLSAYIAEDIKTKYFFCVYLYMKDKAVGLNEEGKVIADDYISNLYSNAKYVDDYLKYLNTEISYQVIIYDVNGKFISSSAASIDLENTKESKIFISDYPWGKNSNATNLNDVSGFTSDGSVKLYNVSGFDKDAINKIVIVIDSVTSSDSKAPISSIKWKEGGDTPQTEFTLMESVGANVELVDSAEEDIDPSDFVVTDPDVNSVETTLRYLVEQNIYLAKLYKDADLDPPTDDLYLYKYITPIKWTGYSQNCDNQYKSFIHALYIEEFPEE